MQVGLQPHSNFYRFHCIAELMLAQAVVVGKTMPKISMCNKAGGK